MSLFLRQRLESNSTLCKNAVLIAVLLLFTGSASAQERWFQVEVSIFSNESLADRAQEMWQPGRRQLEYPQNMQRLQTLLDILLVDSLLTSQGGSPENPVTLDDSQATPEQLALDQIAAVGPPAPTRGEGFRFIDFDRDSYLQLPGSQSDFQQTNRALDRSPDNRLLFHGLWRQPVENTENALPVYVSGGQRFGDQAELQGSITIRFNDNRDRVVIDTDLWLTEFSTLPLQDVDWELPDIPLEFMPAQISENPDLNSATWHPIQVYHMQQSREMRSTEFHYLDHPAIGVVIMVLPYERPPQLQPAIEF